MCNKYSPHTAYTPTWPETVILWGAGATAALGFPTTQQIGRRICVLAREDNSDGSLEKRVREAFPDEDNCVGVVDLLRLLGDHEARRPMMMNLGETYRRHFNAGASEIEAARDIAHLRASYDWGVLACIVRLCPSGSDPEKFQLIDLFNMIDLHIGTQQGFHGIPNDHGENFIRPETLVPARNALKLLTCLMMFGAWKRARVEKKHLLEQYLDFTRQLARLMQREGLDMIEAGEPHFDRRSFYLFSYAVISLNWDPLFLWLIFMAHKEANEGAGVPCIGEPAVPMKLFHDMGHQLGVRRVEAKDPLVWFPLNEGTAQRLNDRAHVTDRVIRMGKFYFPHGSTSFRECPNCGKLIVAFGDQWDSFSESLFPPPMLRCFSRGAGWSNYRRCEEERDCFEKGNADAILCWFCGEMTESRHTPLVMQSSFKGQHPSYIEEIQRDMRVALENAQHIVLMGYSLPKDDFIYRSLLSARKNRKRKAEVKCSIVNRQEGFGNEWLNGDAMFRTRRDYLQREWENLPAWTETVEQASQVFGKENIRLNLCGVPGVFLENGRASERLTKELLYPKFAFSRPIVESRRSASN